MSTRNSFEISKFEEKVKFLGGREKMVQKIGKTSQNGKYFGLENSNL